MVRRYALSGSDDKTLMLWKVPGSGVFGECVQTLELESAVLSVFLSANGQHAVSGCIDGTISLWFLDWALEEIEPTGWDEGARPYLDIFLRARQKYAATLPTDREPTEAEVKRAFTRKGRPEWSEEDFTEFLHTLGCAGYGWLRPEGVRRQLEQMTAAWKDPR